MPSELATDCLYMETVNKQKHKSLTWSTKFCIFICSCKTFSQFSTEIEAVVTWSLAIN